MVDDPGRDGQNAQTDTRRENKEERELLADGDAHCWQRERTETGPFPPNSARLPSPQHRRRRRREGGASWSSSMGIPLVVDPGWRGEVAEELVVVVESCVLAGGEVLRSGSPAAIGQGCLWFRARHRQC